MNASLQYPLNGRSDVEALPVFLILRRTYRWGFDPLESKLDDQYVLGHLTNLTENQIVALRVQVSELVTKYGATYEVIALLDRFDANNQARRLELLLMAKDMKSIIKKKEQQPETKLIWPYRLALVVDELAKIYEKENARTKPQKINKRPGRKVQYDPDFDRQITEAWNTNQHKTYLDLANARGKGETYRDIKLAIDRHKKRSKDQQP